MGQGQILLFIYIIILAFTALSKWVGSILQGWIEIELNKIKYYHS